MKTLATFLFILVSTSHLSAEHPWKLAEELLIHVEDGLSFKETKDEHASHGYLSDIIFTETTSSPKSFIVEGHIKHSNNGGPLERIPVYFSKDKDSVPRLAAMTNCDGNFKFRLWIEEDERRLHIQTTKDFSGYLYAMGSFEVSALPLSLGSYTQRYSLRELKNLGNPEAEPGSGGNG